MKDRPPALLGRLLRPACKLVSLNSMIGLCAKLVGGARLTRRCLALDRFRLSKQQIPTVRKA
jgi:hypothetical protein